MSFCEQKEVLSKNLSLARLYYFINIYNFRAEK